MSSDDYKLWRDFPEVTDLYRSTWNQETHVQLNGYFQAVDVHVYCALENQYSSMLF